MLQQQPQTPPTENRTDTGVGHGVETLVAGRSGPGGLQAVLLRDRRKVGVMLGWLVRLVCLFHELVGRTTAAK